MTYLSSVFEAEHIPFADSIQDLQETSEGRGIKRINREDSKPDVTTWFLAPES